MSSEVWDQEDPRQRFWKRLVRERAVEFLKCPDYMKKLRFNYEQAKSDQALFGDIWAEYGTNVFQLIAEAHGETWDAEDEEKHCVKKDVAVNQRKEPIDDDLVGARQESARERQHLLQGEPEASLGVLEEEQGQVGNAEEEEAARQGPQGRREGFYRRAGGTGGT